MDITRANVPQNPPLMGEHSQTANRREKCPHDIQISPKHTDAQGSQQLSVGGATEGRHPIQWCCKGSVLTHKGAPYNPHNMQKPLRTYRCTDKYGGHMEGCVHPCGHTNMGVYKCTGAYKHRGHPETPKYKKHAYH